VDPQHSHAVLKQNWASVAGPRALLLPMLRTSKPASVAAISMQIITYVDNQQCWFFSIWNNYKQGLNCLNSFWDSTPRTPLCVHREREKESCLAFNSSWCGGNNFRYASSHAADPVQPGRGSKKNKGMFTGQTFSCQGPINMTNIIMKYEGPS